VKANETSAEALALGDTQTLPARAKVALHAALKTLARGDLAGSERELTVALALAPEHAEPHRLLGIVLLRAGQPAHACACFESALQRRPGDADLLTRLAQAQADSGDLAGAIATARALVASRADAAHVYFLAGLLDRHGESEAARDAAAQALALDPQHAKARLLHARCLFQCGELAVAQAQYRQLLDARRESAAAWHGLAELRTVRFDADDRAALTALARAASSPLERATVLHVLGRAQEDGGNYPAAFASFCAAAELERAAFPWQAAAFEKYVDELRDAFAGVEPVDGERGTEVIFIVGMPRSGSTVVEQILAAHSAVEGASELPDLQAVIQQESARRQAPLARWAPVASAADWRRLGEAYLLRTQRWRQHKPRCTDKMPGNWLFAAAALAMLPGARIVDCRRDALETCWSCFTQFFAPGLVPWSRTFADLAHYSRLCSRGGDELAARHPQRVRVQRYEALVDDPEAQIRALLEFCGLPFEPACLRPHEARRVVRTASAGQVRSPLLQGPSKAARYGVLLDPLRAALAVR